MRIISGNYKGKIITAPKNLPVRPTTDYAKTGLFNILRNRFNLTEVSFLDLFCGTGNISFEMISEGAASVLAVDAHAGCVVFANKIFKELNFETGRAIKADVFIYLMKLEEKFDIIFADPPYRMEGVSRLPDLIFENNLLNENGLFILEHQSKDDYSNHANFLEKRKYGNVGYSFFILS
jgi:16S rRNA (guanine(966)-N(2))-methyltransferase RsmD